MLRSMATITFNRWQWTEKNTLWRKFFLLCCHNSSDGAHMPLLGNKQLLRSCFAPVYSYIPGNPLKLWPWPIKTSRLPTGQCFCALPYANLCFVSRAIWNEGVIILGQESPLCIYTAMSWLEGLTLVTTVIKWCHNCGCSFNPVTVAVAKISYRAKSMRSGHWVETIETISLISLFLPLQCLTLSSRIQLLVDGCLPMINKLSPCYPLRSIGLQQD